MRWMWIDGIMVYSGLIECYSKVYILNMGCDKPCIVEVIAKVPLVMP